MAKLTSDERQELIDHLVGNCDCEQNAPVFNEDNFDMLEGMTDRQLLLLVENSKMPVEVLEDEEMEEEEEVEAPELEEEEEAVAPAYPMKKKMAKPVPAMVGNGDHVFNMDSLPAEIQEDIRYARGMKQQQKDQLVAKITTNKNGMFTTKELQVKSIEELTKLASYVSAPAPEAKSKTPRLGGHRNLIKNQSSTDDNDILEVPYIDYGSDNN